MNILHLMLSLLGIIIGFAIFVFGTISSIDAEGRSDWQVMFIPTGAIVMLVSVVWLIGQVSIAVLGWL